MSLLSLPLLTELFDALPLGVIVLDAAGRVVVFNRTEERLAARQRAKVLGRDFFVEIAPCMNVRDLGGRFREHVGRDPLDATIEFSFPFPMMDQPRDVRVRMLSFEAAGAPYGMLTIEDLSLQRSVERMKDSLQSFLVHDLKNPLAVIIANLGFARDAPAVRAEIDVAEALDDGLQAAQRLQRMLVTLLDVTRLETNALPIQRRAVDLVALAESVASAARGVARSHGAAITARGASAPVVADIDEALVRRALENLVDNALRYAKHVEVSAALDGDDALLFVADDGGGIPAAVRERIFDKFVQVGSPTNAGANRGLGLTFVRLAARAHGGDVTVDCPPAGGTVFTLRVPRVPTTTREAP